MLKKTIIDIQGMSCQHCVKTVKCGLTGLDGVKSVKVNLRKNQAVVKYDSLLVTVEELKDVIIEVGFDALEKKKSKSITCLTTSLVSIILLTSVIGCSDIPYTGPILSVDNVDRYLDTIGHDTVCLQDGFDTICLKIVGLEDQETLVPAILEFHPESVEYKFFYKNIRILEASMAMDTTENWTIQIYYPDSYPETERGQDPETSGFDIKVAEGSNINIENDEELELKNFRQRDKDDGSRLAEFYVFTESREITIQVDGLVSNHIVIFYINAEDIESDEVNSKLLFEPK